MSSSAAESSMDHVNRRKTTAGDGRRMKNSANRTVDYSGEGEDTAAWNVFADSFSQVQTVLDRNRDLIQQANENHQSKMPDNMLKNVAIINELNGNIAKVASIYSDLESGFGGSVGIRQRGDGKDGR